MDGQKARERGYLEVEHTADWGLRAWAEDLPALFCTAAEGMYALMDVRLAKGPEVSREIHLEAADLESLLVAFLDELLYQVENGHAFARMDLSIAGGRLDGSLRGKPIETRKKEIKAVTFHQLEVRQGPKGWETTVIFDV